MASGALLAALPGAGSAQDGGRKTYSPLFRAQAVARVQAGQSLSQVARDLGIARNTLRGWRDEPMVSAGPMSAEGASALSGSRREMLVALRAKVAELIESGISGRDMPANARLLMEIGKEIEALDASDAEDEAQGSVEDGQFDPEAI